ncbi:DUF1330 domain-containing protein [Pelagibius litoralis]|uniref:DUF1330 domain-containing protein n=1 Tax=Pelagibius litoralis TaxID=374515 RepID=A0A967F133_9PROT|nr:DUF1330 domain-containing protein [Pelagibius litoralis]NIA71057.1 DUF1330 domain-containing protein [Pelagibius litoralis]
MAAYIIAHLDVTNPEAFEAYRDAVPAVVADHGGRYLARGAPVDVLEGDWEIPRLIILEFPDKAAAEGFYHSAEYQEILPLRLENADGAVVIVEGVEG